MPRKKYDRVSVAAAISVYQFQIELLAQARNQENHAANHSLTQKKFSS